MRAFVLSISLAIALSGPTTADTTDPALAPYQGAWRSREGDYALKIEGKQGTFCEGNACLTGVTTVAGRVGSAVVLQIYDEPALHARGIWVFSAEPDRLQIQNSRKEVITLVPVSAAEIVATPSPPPPPPPTIEPEPRSPTLADFEVSVGR